MALLNDDRYCVVQGLHPIAAENPLKTPEPGFCLAELQRKAGLMFIASK